MAIRVLIVDDALFMRSMIRDIFSREGFEVVGEAENGAEAVRLTRELKPDLITMDIVMPVMGRAQRGERPRLVVGIGASAGGPQALQALLAEFPTEVPVPVLVVQHIPPRFVTALVRRLQDASPLPLRVASAG